VESTTRVMVLTVRSILLMPASSTWKFSMPIVRVKPLVVAKVDPVERW
jgi:hypothetical protein